MQLHICFLLLGLILVGHQDSWAQVYRYRSPDGRLIISSTPPADDAEMVEEIPVGRGPSMRTTAKMPSSKPKIGAQTRHRHQATRHSARPRHVQTPRPVSTHQFGLLQVGSTKADVLRVLGPPADRVKQGKKQRMVHLQGRYIQRKVKVETWYYPGSNRLRPTRLVFYDNLLGEKDKGGY